VSLSNVWAYLAASGPIAVFLIFVSPFGPGAVAGILLARTQGLAPGITIGLYVLSDVVDAVVLEPVIRWLPRFASQSRLGQRILSAFNRVDSLTDVVGGRLGRPIGLVTFTFATDFFTAAIVSTGIVISRIVAWTCIIVGDVTWFVIIYVASMSVASFLTDNRLVFVFTLVLGFGLPAIIRRLVRRRVQPAGPREYPPNPRSRPTGGANPNRPPSRPVSTELGRDET
jgi:hypothetical protein